MEASDFFKEDMVELIRTIQKGNEAHARELITGGLSLNVYGNDGITPLFYFLVTRDKPALRLALKLGADPQMPDDDGDNPLALAVGEEDTELVEILLAGESDPNSLDRNGDPVLFEAIGQERLDQLEMLIQYGADVNLRNRSNETSLLHCAYLNKYEIAYHLLTEHGADYTVRDRVDSDIAWHIYDGLENNLLNPQYPAHDWALKVKQELIDRGYPWPPPSPREVRWAEGRPNKFDLEARHKEEQEK